MMRMRTDNAGTGIVGTRMDKEVTDEREHFYTCDDCGQAVDMRDLGQVIHHEEPGHDPLALDA